MVYWAATKVLRSMQDGKSTKLGNFATQESAARAYDKAAVTAKGLGAVGYINFDLTDYIDIQSEVSKLEELAKRDGRKGGTNPHYNKLYRYYKAAQKANEAKEARSGGEGAA